MRTFKVKLNLVAAKKYDFTLVLQPVIFFLSFVFS